MNIRLPDFETDSVLAEAGFLHNIAVNEPVTLEINPHWARPFGMLYMALVLRQWRSFHASVPFNVMVGDSNAVSYAGHMGFFRTISEKITIGKAPGEAIGNDNYVPISRLNIDELRSVSLSQSQYLEDGELIEKESRRLAAVLSHESQTWDLFTYVFRELIRNVPEHSGSNSVWICGQRWKSDEAEIVVLDEGIGVRPSLERNMSHRPYISSDDDALQLALKAGVSQAFRLGGKQKSSDTWANSGFGLYTVSNLVRLLGGSFCLASGSRYVKLDENGKVQFGDTWFNGTAAKVTLKRTLVSNCQAIISELVKKGESDAKQMRNTFTKASHPSISLILKS